LCIGQGDIFFNVANIISSLKFRPTPTEIFIGLFSILFNTHRTKKE